ncbi:MAG TPA: hypothetical protein VNG29_01030 [Candidatus Paceibacterota bacterium]|nr:hypothetical protein [Candidatus Paceibacterota bacterium]
MDILKAVAEDVEQYKRLCKRFNVKKRPEGVYDGHRKELLGRERREEDAMGKRAAKAFRDHAHEISQIITGENDDGELVIAVYATSDKSADGRRLKEALPKTFEGRQVVVQTRYGGMPL